MDVSIEEFEDQMMAFSRLPKQGALVIGNRQL